MCNKESEPQGRGPKSERLQIGGNWEDAVKKAMNKGKPSEGWPSDKN